jgi:hypothetical protein
MRNLLTVNQTINYLNVKSNSTFYKNSQSNYGNNEYYQSKGA